MRNTQAMSMGTSPLFQKVGERIDMEKVLLGLMIVSALYMIWESFNFEISQAATFPRLTAGFVVFGTILLFLRPILPEPLYTFVAEDSQIVGAEEEFESIEEEVETEEGEIETAEEDEVKSKEEEEANNELESSVGRPLPDPMFTALSAIGYGLAGYAAGILWITPVFVAIYGIWFKLSWRVVIALVILSFAIAFGFMEALNAPIDRGEIINQGGL
jgi:hypothetical protein